MKRKKTFLKRLVYGLLVFLFLFHLLPYLIPITQAQGPVEKPFTESHYFENDGVFLHYRSFEPDKATASGENILLVHGLAGSTFSFRHQVEALREAGHQVMAVDLPGFGYSDRKGNLVHSQEQRAQWLWALIDAMGGGEWHLMGHSMGGGTVTAMADERPEAVASLVYIGPALFTGGGRDGRDFWLSYPPMRRWAEVIGRHVLLTPERLGDFLTSAYGREATEEEVQGYLEPLLLPGTERTFFDITLTSSSTPKEALDSLKDGSFPILAIWGKNDSWVSPEGADQLKVLVPRTELLFFDAGHCPMETHAEAFNKSLLQWLDQ